MTATSRPVGATARRPLSIHARLVLLVLTLLVPALLLTAGLLWGLQREAYQTQERQLAATARALALVVDGRVGEQVAALQGLSVSMLLAHGDWTGFAAQAREALSQSDGWVAVRGPDGQQYVNTFGPPTVGPVGGALPAAPGRLVGARWSGQRSGARISNVIWGPTAHQPVVAVIKSVRLDDGRSVDLSVVIPATSFTKLLLRQEPPAGWTATILDGERRVVGRNRGGVAFIGRQASAQMMAAMAKAPRGVLRTHTLDGIPVITAFEELPGYGWSALVAMPREEALGASRRAIALALAGGGLLLTLAVLLALRMGRQIARPVQTVAQAASDWVAGRPANFPSNTGLAETDGLSHAFASALHAVEVRDERQKLLINELNHRVKNTLATVQAVAVHTRGGASSVDDYYAALEGRVIAMSSAHELLTRSSWEGAELGELARQTLSAFMGPQLKIDGPPAQVGPTDALNLALILYELATNASKHGALSTPQGRVQLSWRKISGATRVTWRETGGPSVAPPTHKGFGSRLISRATQQLQPSELSYAADGLRCEFTVHARGADGTPAGLI